MGADGDSDQPGGCHGRAGYLGDHRAVDGIAPLLRQKEEVERYAVSRWSSPRLRLFVDSGRNGGRGGWGAGVDLLLAAVRAGTVRDVVIVATGVLAPTRAAARRALAALESSGARVHRIRVSRGADRGATVRKTRDAAKAGAARDRYFDEPAGRDSTR